MVATLSRLVLLGLLISPVWAMEGDPTRPPASAIAAANAAASAATPAAADQTQALPRLESVFIPMKGQPMAIINGQTVALGSAVGDAKLVYIGADQVLLRGAGGDTRLFLHPDVRITPLSRRPLASARAGDASRKPTP